MESIEQVERALLGGLMIEPSGYPDVSSRLSSRDFRAAHHGRLYDVLGSRIEAGKPIGIVELSNDIRSAETWKMLGGVGYVVALPEECPSTANLDYYADLVREAAARRRLIEIAEWLRASAGGTEETAAELSEAVIAKLGLAAAPRVAAVSWRDAWLDSEATRGTEARYPTGYPALDQLLDGGMAAGDAMVIAARPSMGKTALALSIATYASRFVPAGFISLEMRARKLVDRGMSLVANVDHSAIRTGRRSNVETGSLEAWADSPPRVELWHNPGASLREILGQIRKWWTEGVRVVVIDYLTLIREPPMWRGESTSERVGRVFQALKDMACRLDVALVVLSQLNRKVDERVSQRRREPSALWWEDVALPTDSDLLWSTEIEGIADVILFPLRAERLGVRRPELRDAAVFYVLKNRNGPAGFAPCWWHGPTASYRPLASDDMALPR